MNWFFKKKQPDSEVLATLAVDALTAIISLAEVFKSEKHVDEILSNCEKSPSEASVIWHALNSVIGMAASREAVPDPSDKLYLKCASIIWEYYPRILHKKLYPNEALYDCDSFVDTLFTHTTFEKASIHLRNDFLVELGAWDFLKSHTVPFMIVLNKLHKSYSEIFVKLRIELAKLG